MPKLLDLNRRIPPPVLLTERHEQPFHMLLDGIPVSFHSGVRTEPQICDLDDRTDSYPTYRKSGSCFGHDPYRFPATPDVRRCGDGTQQCVCRDKQS